MRKQSPSLKKEEVKQDSNSVIKKSVLGILTSLIQYPKLATNNAFDLIKEHPKFLFLEDIRSVYYTHLRANDTLRYLV